MWQSTSVTVAYGCVCFNSSNVLLKNFVYSFKESLVVALCLFSQTLSWERLGYSYSFTRTTIPKLIYHGCAFPKCIFKRLHSRLELKCFWLHLHPYRDACHSQDKSTLLLKESLRCLYDTLHIQNKFYY